MTPLHRHLLYSCSTHGIKLTACRFCCNIKYFDVYYFVLYHCIGFIPTSLFHLKLHFWHYIFQMHEHKHKTSYRRTSFDFLDILPCQIIWDSMWNELWCRKYGDKICFRHTARIQLRKASHHNRVSWKRHRKDCILNRTHLPRSEVGFSRCLNK